MRRQQATQRRGTAAAAAPAAAAEAMLQSVHAPSLLLEASDKGRLDVVQCLVKGDVDVNTKFTDGSTALYLASRSGKLDVVQWLVQEGGADVNAMTSDGDTALLAASYNNHWDVVQWLVREGSADVNAKDKNGRTALIQASQSGNLGAVQWLVQEGGADVNVKDVYGNTALLQAAPIASRGQQDSGEAPRKFPQQHSRAAPLCISHWVWQMHDWEWLMHDVNAMNKYGPDLTWGPAGKAVVTEAILLCCSGGQVLTRPNLVVVGAMEAGKTTLADAIDVDVAVPSVSSPRTPADATAGIAIRYLSINATPEPRAETQKDESNRSSPQFTLYDLAGHPEFFMSHELPPNRRRAVFMFVISLATLHEQRDQQVKHWLSHLARIFKAAKDGFKPRVVLVLTHRDCPTYPPSDVKQVVGEDGSVQFCSPWGNTVMQGMLDIYAERLDIHPTPFVVNSLDGAACSGVKALCVWLHEEHAAIVERGEQVPSITSKVIDSLPEYRSQLGDWPVVNEAEFQQWMQGIDDVLATEIARTPDLIRTIVSYLDSIGEIVHLPDPAKVFVSPQFLCGDIIGKVLAPYEFPCAVFNRRKPKKDGHVTTADLARVFGEDRAELVQAVLVDVGLAFSVSDTAVLVPCMLTKKCTVNVWRPTQQHVVIGRRWECENLHDSLGTGLFPRLQVVIRKRAGQSCPILWNGGFAFLTGSKVAVVGLSTLHTCAVDVWVHGPNGQACAAMLADFSAVVGKTLSTWCPGTPVIPLALSVQQLHEAAPAKHDRVAGYTLATLAEVRSIGRSCEFRPTHPPDVPFLMETAGDLLGPELSHRGRHFLAYGVTKYRGPNDDHLADLASCDNDAADMERLFQDRFQYDTVVSEINPSSEVFAAALDQFCQHVQPGDLAVLYFAGHGFQVRNCTYVVPSTEALLNSEDAIVQYGINHLRLLEKLFDRQAGQVVLILDCCQAWVCKPRGGGVGGKMVGSRNPPTSADAVPVTASSLAPADMSGVKYAGADYLVFQAASPSQLAVDGPHNGVFTKHVKRHFETATADTDLCLLARQVIADVRKDPDSHYNPKHDPDRDHVMKPYLGGSTEHAFHVFEQPAVRSPVW